jgi:hypothetical protein
MAFATGALAAIQVAGYYALKASAKESMRAAVMEVLKEHKLISQGENQEALRQFLAGLEVPRDYHPEPK